MTEPTRRDRRESDELKRREFLRAGLVSGAALAAAGAGYVVLNDDLFGSGDESAVSSAARSTTTSAAATTTTVAKKSKSHGVYAGWVKDENARPGTNDWNISIGAQDSIEGYFDTTSAVVGDTVHLYVSTTWPQYRVQAYRMGYYQGLGGRLVWSSPMLPGRKQITPPPDPQTHMVDASGWQDPYSIEITKDFVPGCYLFKLTTSAGDGRLVELTIRDDHSHAAYLVMNAVTTWQAYNRWGGYSLYLGDTPGGAAFENRARVVSFDRPYDTNGAPEFLGVELPVVRLVEQLGLDVTYATNVDMHRKPEWLSRHKALISLGHDEYWTLAMRDGAEKARDEGVNIAFFGANAAFRQMRFEPSALGPDRHEVCYKSAAEDPMTSVNPTLTTVNWREAPVNRPESQLIGGQYECNPVSADMVITNPGNWVFAGTGLQQGSRLADVVGGEYDRYYPGPGIPSNVEILAHSPLVCQGKASFGDMTYYTAASGAGVFDTGTQTWITRLDQRDLLPEIVTMTTNVLLAFGKGPAGHDHPSQPNT